VRTTRSDGIDELSTGNWALSTIQSYDSRGLRKGHKRKDKKKDNGDTEKWAGKSWKELK